MPRDILLFLVVFPIAIVLGWLTTRGASPERPTWPVRLYISLFRSASVSVLRRYGESRTQSSRREQLLAAVFVWFFVLFVLAQFFFGCSARTGQGFMCS